MNTDNPFKPAAFVTGMVCLIGAVYLAVNAYIGKVESKPPPAPPPRLAGTVPPQMREEGSWLHQLLGMEHLLGVGYITNIMIVGTTNTMTINITR